MTSKQFMNNSDMCIVCFSPPNVRSEKNVLGEETKYELIKHHVSYFPEIIAFVHYSCHKKIHDMPLVNFIQYKDGDSRKFYDMQKEK